jgi:two-component system, NarL family, sensor kinase
MTADPTGLAADGPRPYAASLRDEAAPRDADGTAWVTVAGARLWTRQELDRPVRVRRVVVQFAAAALAVLAAVGIAGSLASRRIAGKLSVHDAAQVTDILADSVVQPALTDAMATSPAAAHAGLDPLVRGQVLSPSLVRVKLWTPQGTIVYSDEPRLVGRTFRLDGGARTVLTDPQTSAEISDLTRPENQYERTYGKLLEVYRPVWTPTGKPLLFETYFRYDVVSDRTSQLWRGFVGIMLSCIAAIFVLLIPLVWTLLARARRAQGQREAMMQRAVDASLAERRRIAATLHDGLVQQLAAASFAVASGAEAAQGHGYPTLAATLREAGAGVRNSLGATRALLVDIYPPNLQSAGLGAALRDVAATVAGREPDVSIDIDDEAADSLSAEQQQGVFRVAQEALRNAARHSGARNVRLVLRSAPTGTDLRVEDDGAGFDAQSAQAEDHFGLRLMADAATGIGANLRVRTSPRTGTAWLLEVPR